MPVIAHPLPPPGYTQIGMTGALPGRRAPETPYRWNSTRRFCSQASSEEPGLAGWVSP